MTLALLNFTVLTHMLLQAQQSGLHKVHLSLVLLRQINSHSRGTEDKPYTTCPRINQNSKQVWNPYNLL